MSDDLEMKYSLAIIEVNALKNAIRALTECRETSKIRAMIGERPWEDRSKTDRRKADRREGAHYIDRRTPVLSSSKMADMCRDKEFWDNRDKSSSGDVESESNG